jgi:putative thiamine transport system ATP-binding protein
MMDSMTDNQGLVLEHVRIALEGRDLVSISARVKCGETLTVMGPSGSGKSTLLAYLGGFLDPVLRQADGVYVDGVDLTALEAEKRHAGILFQDPLLFPHLSVADNIAIAIPRHVRGRRQRRAMAEAALEDAGLAGFGDSDPDTLSGGQKARVALQRVLAVATADCCCSTNRSPSSMPICVTRPGRWCSPRRGGAGLPVVLVTHDEADAAVRPEKSTG